MYVCNSWLCRVNPVLQTHRIKPMPPPHPPLPPPVPLSTFPISFLENTKPSLNIQVQNVAEVFHHTWKLLGGMLLQPGAHHLVEGICKLGDHRPDFAASVTQDPVFQEEPEHGQGIALDDFGFLRINRFHKHCRTREKSFLKTLMQTSTYLYFWFLEAFSG